MPRLAFKPDASFFEKIVIGAVGARAVVADLNARGHRVEELENGSTATKLWKDVKRKRVRIPDLVCVNCGLRVESRAKSKKPSLAVSHSDADAERKWDYGLVPTDLVAFPTCTKVESSVWSTGRIEDRFSYWHSRDRASWETSPVVNYARVKSLRLAPFTKQRPKGVTEGSEVSILWDAVFSARTGKVDLVDGGKIRVQGQGGQKTYTAQNRSALPVHVSVGDQVRVTQILAAHVAPASGKELQCPGALPKGHIESLLKSPERTQRFTAVKLARLRKDASFSDKASSLVEHAEEDMYVRLEAAAYLVNVCGKEPEPLFEPFLTDSDEQVRLEAVVALGAAGTVGAVKLLGTILSDTAAAYYLRSAAAWALGQIGTKQAVDRLISAFADQNLTIRGDALEAVEALEKKPVSQLTDLLIKGGNDISAGAAEVIRRYGTIPEEELEKILVEIGKGNKKEWLVWLLASLPQGVDYVDAAVAELQQKNPQVHFALSVLWTFLRSWIAPTWELRPTARPQDS